MITWKKISTFAIFPQPRCKHSFFSSTTREFARYDKLRISNKKGGVRKVHSNNFELCSNLGKLVELKCSRI